MPTLRRIKDGQGDSGSRAEAIKWNEDGTLKEVIGNGKPVVGCSFLVGSLTARSYSTKDYWLTTEVTEIIEEKYDKDNHMIYCKFKTKNSEYEVFE